MRLRFACSGQNAGGTCTYPERKVSISSNGQWSDITEELAITFNWPAPADPQQNDLETFRLNTDRLYFNAKGSVDRGDGNGSANFFSLDDSAVQVRCDRGVAQVNTSGCVLPLAAPVYVVDSAPGSSTEEAGQHIREAQNGPLQSPGKFLMKAGTRAVADQSVSSPVTALQRLKRPDLLSPGSPNRFAACNLRNANSLANIGPRQYSNTCQPTTPNGLPDIPRCDCDEYPFNSTYQGAAYQPDSTSVKGINADQNKAAGTGNFTGWYLRERVLDLGTGREDGLPMRGISDYFWVHVP